MSIVVVSASLSPSSSTHRLGSDLAAAVVEAGVETEVKEISLRSLAHALVDNLLTGFPSPQLQEAVDAVVAADGLVAVTPVYNAGYSGLFKLFLDVLEKDSLRGKPVLLGATGGSPRHSLITEYGLRPLFTYMHASVAATAVYASTEDFGAHAADSDGSAGTTLRRRISRAGRDLAALIRAQNPGALQNAAPTSPSQSDSFEGAATNANARAQELFPDFKPMGELFKQERD
ncbi:CE1759 family FMN reductase [Gleimia hominis]|uniref:CE1759 family FMN reductase n=1 Tax=Gleimia hominis TaxID=595468 RepID=UPI000C80D49F|nr:CE1759 family FMN reductase [Gleimia hominis]WIK63920.1 NAD(P)H-dependent oxidoreductase [Gleimia hominis]